ncbi:hypothetical protein L596_016421 [Steinernema carpocapsae]|uniref:Uncharacterized protein n=1 Tax=Steinernema carpocapsae TaxID=34508 RepID=A0A4U5NIW8_STECR|nr:hypothetical protein L596_016421 [Steinernema carpocapsae]
MFSSLSPCLESTAGHSTIDYLSHRPLAFRINTRLRSTKITNLVHGSHVSATFVPAARVYPNGGISSSWDGTNAKPVESSLSHINHYPR